MPNFLYRKKIKVTITIKQSTLETDSDKCDACDTDVSLAGNDNHKISQAISLLKSSMICLIASTMWVDHSWE